MASAPSHNLMVFADMDLPVARYSSAPAGASLKRNSRFGVAAATRRSTASAGAITSWPMPSPGSTAIWKALLADMDLNSGDGVGANGPLMNTSARPCASEGSEGAEGVYAAFCRQSRLSVHRASAARPHRRRDQSRLQGYRTAISL